MESTGASWVQYWSEFKRLIMELRAAGEAEWADVLESKPSGGGTGSEVTGVMHDTLQRFERTEISERLGVQNQTAKVICLLERIRELAPQESVRQPAPQEKSVLRIRALQELYDMANALISDLDAAGEEQFEFYLRHAMQSRSGQQALWELSGYLSQLKRAGTLQRLQWQERGDAMLDYIELPLDETSRPIPSTRIPPPAKTPS